MKCVQHQGNKRVRRVTDEEAEEMTRHSAWRYCPKRLWKEQEKKITAARAG